MVASLLYYIGRIARWFTAQWAFDFMCMARAPANLVAGPAGLQLREVAAARSNSRGLRCGTSSGRYIRISSNLLERLNGALAMTGPRISCCRETTKDYQVSKC